MSETWTVLRILEWTTGYFRRAGVESARLDAELLLSHVLGIERIQLYVQYERPLDQEERDRYRALVARRGRGEPTQYLVGEQEFWSLPIAVEPGVLIPRGDTEILVEEALAEARRLAALHGPALRLADVGTGSGCVAVALAHELPEARVWAGDIADVPLRLAPRNAAANGVGDRVHVVRGAGLAPLLAAAGGAPFHLVASNPPYIPDGLLPGLMREVRDHEPREALAGGRDGLDVLAPLVRDAAAPGALVPGGALAVEISDAAQAETVARLMGEAGLGDVRVRDDYAGTPRVVVGRRATG